MEVDRSTRGDAWLVAFLVVVCGGSAGALGALERWKSEPGAVGAVPSRWPASTAIARADGLPTLLLFVSPDCPCSRASLHELAELTRAHAIDAVVVVASEGDAAATLAAVHDAGARGVLDAGKREATRFGAKTSGQVLLFAPDGRRLYAGGITVARGHEGDNAGSRTIVSALAGVPAHEESPVYGCALHATEGTL